MPTPSPGFCITVRAEALAAVRSAAGLARHRSARPAPQLTTAPMEEARS